MGGFLLLKNVVLYPKGHMFSKNYTFCHFLISSSSVSFISCYQRRRLSYYGTNCHFQQSVAPEILIGPNKKSASLNSTTILRSWVIFFFYEEYALGFVNFFFLAYWVCEINYKSFLAGKKKTYM